MNVRYCLNDLTAQKKRGMFKFQERGAAVYTWINAAQVYVLQVYALIFLVDQ